ncbi:MAG: Myo-inositol 2-dehydrogenase [Candidatus Solibacter sp.]|nr:Myo-inositol 2-dehydrogenase [Candidatus Solibacter sp.]
MGHSSVPRRALLSMAAAPLFLPRRVFGANDRIRIGVIGAGGRANLLMDQLPPGAEIVAVADCYPKRADEAVSKRKANWSVHHDHRALLDLKDIDGVIIATADHQRVLCSIHACQAGKDVYAEKPLTLYIAEGRALVKAARRYNRVFQVGSQQRSMAMNRVACEFVRSGGLGKLLFVQGVNYPSSSEIPALPEQPLPDGMNWDLWLSQAPERPYNAKLHTGWMQWRDYAGGEMTNWGAHGMDQLQWGLGTDLTGPVELWPMADSAFGAVAFRYASGATVRLEMPAAGSELQGGVIFVGEKGRVEVVRNGFRADPVTLIKDVPPREEVEKWNRAQWQAQFHMQDWLDAMRQRSTPVADVEIGHRSVSVCHLVNITRQLNRKVKWDPDTETFPGDAEANAFVDRPRRKGYELPRA